MSLATRCPACGTVFRVVRDQLKVSEGWVRCGRCSEVFNAGQRLFDLEQDRNALVVLPPRPTAVPTQQAAPRRGVADEAAPAGLAPLSPAAERVSSAWAPPSRPAVLWAPDSDPMPLLPSTPATPASDAEAMARGDASAESGTDTATPSPADALVAATAHGAPAALDLPTQDTAQPAAEAATPTATEPEVTPGFVLRADRAARWQHPAWRGGLALLALLLAALLAAQMALHYRDSVAAAWPLSRPWLQAACSVLGCRIEAPRRIDSLSVESSGLVRIEGSPQYRLSMVVLNKASTAVRMPAIDLALTDTQGQTMARRVFFAAELGQPADSLAPRSEVALQALLELGDQRVAGYTVELFYP